MSRPVADRIIERMGFLEPVGGGIQKLVGGFYGVLGPLGRGLKNLAHGTKPLGHPLHPALSDIPIGAWTAGVVADIAAHWGVVPRSAGTIALIVGLIGAVLAAGSGLTDHHETYGHEMHVATAHALTMVLAVVVDAVSLALRAWTSAHTLAVALAIIGLVLVYAGGYLGGHLVFGVGTMVNHTAFEAAPSDFTAVGSPADFPEGKLVRVLAGDVPVLLVRTNGTLRAMAATCTHAGGPLDEGEISGDCVVCPWHGSRFRLTDGHAVKGPATFDQPLFRVRETDGRIEVQALESHS